MRISIVTISYNQVVFLQRAIESVLAQGYRDLDYIVVDPGSTDGSRDVIQKYAPRLTRTLLEPDKGPADGLNKGFALAGGEVFGFLNADDTLLPGALDAVAEYFRSHPRIDVMSGNGYVTDAADRVLRKVYSDRYSLRAVAHRSAVLIQQATFFREHAFRRAGGFNPLNRCTWDGELWVAMAEAGARFGLLDEFLACYRLHETSITGSGNLDRQINEYNAKVFHRIMGRHKGAGDSMVRHIYKLKKHLVNHRDTVERIRRGPVYRRFETAGHA